MSKTKFTSADVELACAGVRKAGIVVATLVLRVCGSDPQKIIAAARRVATKWNELAERMEKLVLSAVAA
jgi:hypothetical protein